MEGQKKLAELNALEFLNRASNYNDNVAKGAQVLYKNDVSGDVFLTMKNADFRELGIESFGVIKSLQMFRDKMLESEKKNQSVEPIPENLNVEDIPEDIKEDFDDDIPGMQDYNYQPGETIRGELTADGPSSTSEDIFSKPKETPGNLGESDAVDDCGICLTEKPKVQEKKIPRVDYNKHSREASRLGVCDESLSDMRYIDERKVAQHLTMQRVKDANDSYDNSRLGSFEDTNSIDMRTGSVRSMPSMVSSRSIFGKRKLKDWVINEKVTWTVDGKKRSADTFMELRTNHEILHEGYLQKLKGVNSKFMVNRWTGRYGVLLKSRVFLLFQYDRKTLYQKKSADLRLVGNVGGPQRDISADILKFEIFFKTNKRIVLGFKNEPKLLMWRDDILSLVRGYDNPKSEDEKENM